MSGSSGNSLAIVILVFKDGEERVNGNPIAVWSTS